jgi:hypothetical protein
MDMRQGHVVVVQHGFCPQTGFVVIVENQLNLYGFILVHFENWVVL